MSATPLDAFHRWILIAALLVHAITAWFSSGYYAADEHYQVIAFAQQKMGELPANELPWEYDARIRSGFLPGIAYGAIVGCRALFGAEPLLIAFMLRLLTALFALAVVRSFVRAALPQVAAPLHRPFILLSYFLWFLPYQHVRFASETWAGLFFLLGLAQLLDPTVRRRSWLIAGLCLGLCVQLKPAMIAACGGAMALCPYSATGRGRSLLLLTSGGLVSLIVGTATDSWFYHEPMHTLWNYLYKNSLSITKVQPLPLLDETYPWWYYFAWIVKYGIWPIGALLVGALAWLTWKAPKSWPVWCIWPYLLLISAIPHKEFRFLFPLVDLAPLVLVLAFGHLQEAASWSRLDGGIFQRIGFGVLGLLLVIDISGLVTAGLTAAGTGRMRLAERLSKTHPSEPMTLGYALDEPWIWDARIPGFYLSSDLKDVGPHDPCSLPADRMGRTEPALLIAPSRLEMGYGCVPGNQGYHEFCSSEAPWATTLLDWYNSERHAPFTLNTFEARTSPLSEP